LTFSDKATDVFTCMEEIAAKVRVDLKHLDPEYFPKLADGMLAWLACWKQLNPEVQCLI